MGYMLRTWNPKARKAHRCSWCGEDIEVGEVHSAWVGIYDGFYQGRMHIECIDAFNREDPYEGEFEEWSNPRGKTEYEIELEQEAP